MPIDDSLDEKVRDFTNFKVEQHRLEFIGLCAGCQSLARNQA